MIVGVPVPATVAQSNNGWGASPAAPTMRDPEVHIWKAALDLPPVPVHSLAETLSEDERARARRFRFRRDRSRFIVCRGGLRTVLGRYLRVAPASLVFRYNRYGKPALSDGALGFNVSHADGMALYAVASGREVGIDIERIRGDFPSDQIAEGFFSRREIDALRMLGPASRREAFFTWWTRKEAYVKASGHGLALPLDQFDVSAVPSKTGRPATLPSGAGAPHDASRWSFCDLFVGSDYVAAIVAEGRDWRLQRWEW